MPNKFSEYFKKIFSPSLFFIFFALILTEISSYFGYIFFDIDHLFWWGLIILALFLSLKNIKYGVWLVLLELFIGSKGYLLHYTFNNTNFSLRLGLWIVVISIWGANFILSFFKKNEIEKSIFLKPETYQKANFPYFSLFFIFLAWGVIRGLGKGNIPENLFFDANNWLYFLLIFPIYETLFNKNLYDPKDNPLLPISRIFIASIAWLSLKTFILLFIFSHSIIKASPLYNLLMHQVYHWVRDTGIGEITIMPSGFSRIFIQSQIFIFFAFYLALFILIRFWDDFKQSKKLIMLSSLFLIFLNGTIIISYSRSAWLGIIALFPFFAVFTIKKYAWSRFWPPVLICLLSAVLSIGLIALTVKFPFPSPANDFSITKALTERATNINNEAAVSSRYALLPELWKKIKKNPILGEGFGATITYKANTPAILEKNPDGYYTTYAFEWGWLDIWLKLGFFGLAAYLLLLVKIIISNFKKNLFLTDSLAFGLILISFISIFSPFTNHPLGIGFIILAAAIAESMKNPFSCAC